MKHKVHNIFLISLPIVLSFFFLSLFTLSTLTTLENNVQWTIELNESANSSEGESHEFGEEEATDFLTHITHEHPNLMIEQGADKAFNLTDALSTVYLPVISPPPEG